MIKLNKLIQKFKKQKKSLRIAYLVTGIVYLLTLIFFIKSVLSLVGIETLIRGLILMVLILFIVYYIFAGLIFLFTNKNKTLIFTIVLAIMISLIMGVGSFYIDKTFSIINKVQKKYVNYTSSMVSLKETESYNTLGMISAHDDPTGYIIPNEMIKKYNIKGKIVEYDDYYSMMSDLYDKKIDALFISNNYQIMFQSLEKYANINEETKTVYELSKKLENSDNIQYSTKNLTEPFTILLMGVDSTGDGIDSAASFNGDTLMLISFNPKTLSSTIFSIPRDTYVPIACRNNSEAKINSSAYGGTSCVVKTIENLTTIPIDYYVKINFTGVVKLVDDLGGIEVDVPISFCEQDSERRFEEYEICLEKGLQKLNGEQALALARHRHTLPLGDFQRVQHQQLVVEAMAAALKNVKDLENFYAILDDIINNVDTNMTTEQILSLYQVGKNILLNKIGENTKLSIQKTYLTGYDLTMYLPSARSYSYTFQYYKQSLDDIVKTMKINLEIEKPGLIKTFEWSASTVYEPYVAGKNYYNEKRRELVPSFIGQNLSYVNNWAKERNLEVKTVEVGSDNPLYNPSLSDGTVVYQDTHQGILVDSLKSITVSVLKRSAISETPIVIEDPISDNNEETPKEKLPDFIGMSISEFNKWKTNLKNSSIVIETKELNVDDLLSISSGDLKNNVIYKQTDSKGNPISEGTSLEEITTLIIHYFKEQN